MSSLVAPVVGGADLHDKAWFKKRNLENTTANFPSDAVRVQSPGRLFPVTVGPHCWGFAPNTGHQNYHLRVAAGSTAPSTRLLNPPVTEKMKELIERAGWSRKSREHDNGKHMKMILFL